MTEIDIQNRKQQEPMNVRGFRCVGASSIFLPLRSIVLWLVRWFNLTVLTRKMNQFYCGNRAMRPVCRFFHENRDFPDS